MMNKWYDVYECNMRLRPILYVDWTEMNKNEYRMNLFDIQYSCF